MMFSFRHRLRRQPLACLAATLAAALVVAGLAFWDKIQDDAIHNAAKSGDSVKVEALLNGKADLIASKNGNGRTALHAAADEGHKNVARSWWLTGQRSTPKIGTAGRLCTWRQMGVIEM